MPPRIATPQAGGDAQAAQQLEQLRKRWSSLRDAKIQGQADVKRLEQERAEACADAERDFGTSDLEKLRAMVAEARAQDAAALAAFESNISEAEALLRAAGEP